MTDKLVSRGHGSNMLEELPGLKAVRKNRIHWEQEFVLQFKNGATVTVRQFHSIPEGYGFTTSIPEGTNYPEGDWRGNLYGNLSVSEAMDAAEYWMKLYIEQNKLDPENKYYIVRGRPIKVMDYDNTDN